MSIKKELRKIVHLAWPLLIAQITQTLMGVSDTIMAGHYSAKDMAAVAIGYSITLPVLFFVQGITLALPPIISRLSGADQQGKVANATQQTLWLATLFSVIICFFAPVAPKLLGLVNMSPDLLRITSDYVQYILFCAPFFGFYQLLRNYCEGLSLTKPTMVIMIIGLLVNIPANYVLIYGKFGLPAMGGAGCGLATGLVFVAMFIATFIYVKRTPRLDKYGLLRRFHKPVPAEMWDVFKLGFPIAMTILFEVILFSVVALLLSPLGETVVASHQVALNFSSLMFMFPLSIGMATSIRVAYLLGEEKYEAIKHAVLGSIILGLSIAAVTATMTLGGRFVIAGLYTSNAEVINLAASLMFLAAMFQLSDAIQVISVGSLRGFKDARAMFLITFSAYWLIGFPIGYVLALTDFILPRLNAAGFWIGFICGLTAAAVMLGFRLQFLYQRLIGQSEATKAI